MPAAVIAMLDLIISVDTSVAHLAGAVGKPVALLLPFSPDFRWMLDHDDSPWYPTMRLFRQTTLGDWDSVIARVRDALVEIVRRPEITQEIASRIAQKSGGASRRNNNTGGSISAGG